MSPQHALAATQTFIETALATFPLAEKTVWVLPSHSDLYRPEWFADVPHETFLPPAPGCDLLQQWQQLPADDPPDAIFCVHALGHASSARQAVAELEARLAPGGLLVVAVPFLAQVPSAGGEFWRMTPAGLLRLLEDFEATVLAWEGPESAPQLVFAVAVKSPSPPGLGHLTGQFVTSWQDKFDEPRGGLWRSLTQLWNGRGGEKTLNVAIFCPASTGILE